MFQHLHSNFWCTLEIQNMQYVQTTQCTIICYNIIQYYLLLLFTCVVNTVKLPKKLQLLDKKNKKKLPPISQIFKRFVTFWIWFLCILLNDWTMNNDNILNTIYACKYKQIVRVDDSITYNSSDRLLLFYE